MKKWKVAFELDVGWQIQTIVEASSPIVAAEIARDSLAHTFPCWAALASLAPLICWEVA